MEVGMNGLRDKSLYLNVEFRTIQPLLENCNSLNLLQEDFERIWSDIWSMSDFGNSYSCKKIGGDGLDITDYGAVAIVEHQVRITIEFFTREIFNEFKKGYKEEIDNWIESVNVENLFKNFKPAILHSYNFKKIK